MCVGVLGGSVMMMVFGVLGCCVVVVLVECVGLVLFCLVWVGIKIVSFGCSLVVECSLLICCS